MTLQITGRVLNDKEHYMSWYSIAETALIYGGFDLLVRI